MHDKRKPKRNLPAPATGGVNAATGDRRQPFIQVEQVVDLRAIWLTLIRYRLMILLVSGAFVAITLADNLISRPVFQATTLIQVQPGSPANIRFNTLQQDDQQVGQTFTQTQANIMRSESVALAVIDRLGLHDHPEFTGEVKQRGLLNSSKLAIAAAVRQVKSIIGNVRDDSQTSRVDPSTQLLIAETARLQRFQKQLTIEPLVMTSLIAVKFDSFSPRLSAEIVNAVAAEYLRLTDERRFNSTSGAKEFLQREIAELQLKLEQSETKLTAFAREHNIVDVEQKGNIMTTRLQDLSTRLTAVKSERIAAEAIHRQALTGDIEALPQVLDESLLQRLKFEYTRLQGEYSRLSRVYREAHPELQKLKAQMDLIESDLTSELDKLTSSLKFQYESLREREQKLEQEVDAQRVALLDLQDRAIEYNILKRDLLTNKELFTGLLERMKEIDVAGGMEVSNISVIDKGRVPLRPYRPDIPLNLVIAAVLGLLAGAGAAFLRSYLDDTIKTPNEIEDTLDLECLCILPRVDTAELTDKHLLMSKSSRQLAASFYYEAVQSMRTNLTFAFPNGPPSTILVTSSTGGEGKSTTASNLAVCIANKGLRVLVIDADLRRPNLHNIFGINVSPGLTDYLEGNRINFVRRTEIPNLDVVPAGSATGEPTETLDSHRMDKLLQTFRNYYDHIIVDTCPILGLSDALILGKKVDAVLMVARAGEISKTALSESCKRLHSVNVPLIGAVLNMVDIESQEYRPYFSEYYYQYSSDTPAT